MIMSYITDNDIDLVFVQETWLRKSDDHLLTEIREYGYEIITYRKTRRLDFGGGVAVIFKNRLKFRNIKGKKYASFEHIVCQLITMNGPVKFINIYRPPYSKKNRYTEKKFFEEFSDLLTDVITSDVPYFLVGDYNIHVELSDKDILPEMKASFTKQIKDAKAFIKILNDFKISQLVNKETQISHGTLDLVMTQTDNIDSIQNVNVGYKDEICASDHFPITFLLKTIPMYKENKLTISRRNFTGFSSVQFVEDVKIDLLLERLQNCDANSCAVFYEESMRSALDKQCPIVTKTLRSRPKQKWFDANLRDLKRRKRATERKWKKHPTQEWLLQLDAIKLEYKNAIADTRTAFIRNNLDQNKNDQKKFFKSINYLTGSQQEKILPSYTSKSDLANEMTSFYYNKVKNIREEIQNENTDYTSTDRGECTSSLTDFEMLNGESLKNIIFSMNSKGHPNDPIPVWLLKQCFDHFSPILLQTVNKSLQECTFPDTLKHAVITPIIKDKDEDIESFKNYRPVSNLTFLSKLIEKCVCLQIHKYLEENDLYPKCQSAYRKYHSCETALLKVVNDIQTEVANKKMVALVTLDLSSAFDTIDHELLLSKLKKDFGISGNVLAWLNSYLKNRTFAVKVINVEGKPVLLLFGVPQGSILGPLLFILYIHDMAYIAEKYGLNVHLYADDSELYIGFSPLTETSQCKISIENCLNEIKGWMHANFLKINMDKTKVMFFGRHQELNLFTIDISIEGKYFESNMNNTIKTLGVKLDTKLSMQSMVSESCKSCYLELKKLQSIRRCLDTDQKISLIHANVLSRLDYGNVLLAGAKISLIKQLQKVMNACVRFIYNLRKSQSVTAFSQTCHFLPVKFRIMFKSCLIVYKILNNLSPGYLRHMAVQETRNRDNLRSSIDFTMLKYPDTEKCLNYHLIKYWNNLPIDIRKSSTIEHFKTKLKTYYFRKAYD